LSHWGRGRAPQEKQKHASNQSTKNHENSNPLPHAERTAGPRPGAGTLKLCSRIGERAAAGKEKLEALRVESAKIRNQALLTMEALKRLTVKGVELRPQFEKFKTELTEMEAQAKIARNRADAMKKNGQVSFAAWEQEVQTINNPDIRKEAEKRFNKRKKSYDKILKQMEEAKDELVPFMSDLNDIRKLLESELTEGSVAGTKSTIRSADWHGEDVRDSLADVEKELDRVAAELAKYK
jgi:chromosome segregation ATPase